MAEFIDPGSFDLSSELDEADFYITKKMFDEARDVLERAYHFMPHHKKVREAIGRFSAATGETIEGISGPEETASAPAAPPAEQTVGSATVDTFDLGDETIDIHEEFYDAKFYYEQEMYKDALLSIKKILKIDKSHGEALSLLKEIKVRLQK